MKNILGSALGIAILVALVIVYVITALFLYGISLVWLWHWFITPLGVPGLDVWQAVGISMLAGLLARDWKTKTEDNAELFAAFSVPILLPLLALLFGYFVQLAM